MLAFLKGTLEIKQPTYVILDINGIGFEINIPFSTFNSLKEEGSEIKILTYLYIKEDIVTLYGFATEEERKMFKQIITLPGTGPKIALSLLSCMSVEKIKSSIIHEEIDVLQKVPGIGKKKAKKLILELKEKIEKIFPRISLDLNKKIKTEDTYISNAISALISLGYNYKNASEAVEKAAKENKSIALEELIKKALEKVNES